MKYAGISRLAFWSLCLLGLASSAVAHNGALAIAVPVAGIKVDGDLSDWSAGMRRYPIALEGGDRPKGPADFQGDFRIGYHAQENVLYVAVEVQDQSTVVATTGGSWYDQDGCDIYVDLAHQEEDSPAVQYVVWGTSREVFGAQGALANLQHAELGMRRQGSVHQYEWRVDIAGMSQHQVRLRPDMVLGLDVVVGDSDTDGSFSYMAWGRGGGKAPQTHNRGDLVLAATGQGTGKLQGQVRWGGTSEGVAHARVRVRSLAADRQWLMAEADGNGGWNAEVPAGRYRVGLRWPGRGEKDQEAVQVGAGSAVTVDLMAPVPHGERITAGPGKGHWQTFSVTDGLVNHTVYAILQDRQGKMWFGTEGGVSRYDGRRFTSFTEKDGLAHNWVNAIAEDREGNLWFGTGVNGKGGVSRYDGKGFKTFTTEEGLAGNSVFAILQDQEGQLWFGTRGGG